MKVMKRTRGEVKYDFVFSLATAKARGKIVIMAFPEHATE